ncbi:tRNA (adenosine(37)-N6)-threonylcarbamoyltransferase complex dimerization subunit type 1 TsaB [Aquibium sp. A9E412]|uniref:tRNA (adenosine(37)-N6)-threonylcarbamoyltransferase complex dimerization subunit type 1 TsaB n=1 Tax=Aquibium sp. A9E412 TaxID=2976767 RepID=UPI0025B26425|nr:tRNA (adenosine(37)-N6)-threonylcarbamoyltransferase complex dimerization subunit type 1 TsaB [Aquibium sp. A9E412]MDN2566178.1 tRNA (adenosine(37)-N6)-threonylcarbamoyltransferase complex dimerization subunit type 1 TsaB [Aquibium sp. A9E412]
MTLLAIDTAADRCAACLFDAGTGRTAGRAERAMQTGHAEHVVAVIDAALAAAGLDYAALSAVAVTVGPGSFTGVRVGVAAARGLALALSLPSAGVTTLEGLAAETAARHPGRPVLAAVGNRPAALAAALYDADGAEVAAPALLSAAEAAAVAGRAGAVLCGSAAEAVRAADAALALDADGLAATADIATYARLAARRGFAGDKPRPLYLRPPAAVPQAGFAVPRRG